MNMLSFEKRNLLLMLQVPYLEPQDPVLGHNLRVGANDITPFRTKCLNCPQTKKYQKS
jgi:hypothetical protein